MLQHEFIHGLAGLAVRHRGCVATIGSFDGVHLGHQAILARLRDVARAKELPALVMVFEPQPHEYFSREQAPARLMRLREKVKALFAAGIERVVCLRFDAHLRNLSAAEFIEQILVNGLGVQHLEIGDDFRFGCDRAGDFALLQRAGAMHGFTVRDTPTYLLHNQRVSSTRIRQLLEQDELQEAAELLGRPFSVAGRVIYGRQLGRQIDAATANVGLGRFRSPVQGVYAVEVVRLSTGTQLLGVANVGVRPTVAGGAKPLLEVHLLDFNETLYGECIEVTFRQKLRREQKFASLGELKAQIHKDIQAARQYFIAPGQL